MKIATLLGTRPEIIRLTQVVKVLDSFSEHVQLRAGDIGESVGGTSQPNERMPDE
jgi:hypothetical protein